MGTVPLLFEKRNHTLILIKAVQFRLIEWIIELVIECDERIISVLLKAEISINKLAASLQIDNGDQLLLNTRGNKKREDR